jgi:uncharacterized protein (TIGR02284 family)
MKNEICINLCNSLLAGERSAVEAYDIAIEKFGKVHPLEELIKIRSEHVNAVAKLEGQVQQMGGEPEEDSGIWGAIVKGIQHTANLFGPESAIDSLTRGEEHGRSEYEKAMQTSGVEPACRQLIQTDLLPSVLQHLIVLDKLGKVVD